MAIRVALQHRTTLPLRPAGRSVAARGPAAAGAALPHADPRLLAAASSPTQHFLNWQQDPYGNWVARLVFPERATELEIVVDLDRRHDGDQSVRLLRRAVRRALSVRVRAARSRKELIPFLEADAARAAAAGVARARFARRIAAGRGDGRPCWSALNQQLQNEIRYLVRMEPGVQTPEETLERGERLVPRHGLAAGADPAPPRARGALRVGLSDPARRRRQVARRARRARARFHRPARVGRGLPAGRRLDRPRSDLGPARRRRPHSARVHRRSRQRRAGERLHRRRARRVRRRR